MKAGDTIVYVPDPCLFGLGTVERTLPNGMIVCRFDDGQEETFSPHELELHSVWEIRHKTLA